MSKSARSVSLETGIISEVETRARSGRVSFSKWVEDALFEKLERERIVVSEDPPPQWGKSNTPPKSPVARRKKSGTG